MLSAIRQSLKFMSRGERTRIWMLFISRLLASLLDLIAVGLLGLLATSVALFIANGSDPSRKIVILGANLPAINVSLLPAALGIILSLFLAKAVISIFLTRALAMHVAEIEARASKVVLESLLIGEAGKSKEVSKDEVIYRTNQATHVAFTQLFTNLGTLFAEGALFLGLLIVFVISDPVSTLLVAVYLGIVAACITLFVGRSLQKGTAAIMDDSVQLATQVTDIIETKRELLVLGRQHHYVNRAYQLKRSISTKIANQVYLSSMPRHIIETSVLVGVLLFGALKFATTDVVGALSTTAVFLTGSLRIMAAMLPWQSAFIAIKQALPVVHSISSELETRVTRLSNKKEEVVEGHLHIEFESVTMVYPASQKAAIKNVSFSIPAGGIYAIIGPSGAGKSTLADLIMGISTPNEGRVSIGGATPASLIKNHPGWLAYVPQRPGLISGTLLENIVLGQDASDINEENLSDAIRESNLESVITELPLGINTSIGARKDQLSGGQIQRIGLARALYSKPKIIVMDEATSALDAKSENEVGLALRSLPADVTLILIAHRLQTVKDAKEVLLMNEGCLIDNGSFMALLSRNELMREAVALMDLR